MNSEDFDAERFMKKEDIQFQTVADLITDISQCIMAIILSSFALCTSSIGEIGSA